MNKNHVTGQTGSKQSILENPGVFLNPEQPLIAAVTITKDDVRRQEDRVKRARIRLQVCPSFISSSKLILILVCPSILADRWWEFKFPVYTELSEI